MSDEPSAWRQGIWWDAAAIALVACTASVLLAAPLFPSQDGPVHLYYVDVLRGLLTHAGPYSQHFEIKTFVTPYALEYYSLLALEMVFSPAVSEKLLVGCYIFAFGLGFRYLVESVAERRSPWTLAGIPFCMHRLVYLGFLNYCFGVALLLFLCGFWIRFSGRLNPGRVAALLAGLASMLLTHPVPVAVFLLFIGLDFVTDLVRDAAAGRRRWAPGLRDRRRPLALMAVMAAMALVWVGMFVDRSQPAPSSPSYVSVYGWGRTLAGELELLPVAPFTSLAYRAGPLLLLGIAVLTVLQSSWRQAGRLCSAAVALIATSSICFALYGIVPPRINGSWYFAERFPILWALFLLAAAAALRPPRWWSVATGAIALCVTVGVLLPQWGLVSRIATRIAPALDCPPAQAGSVGLIVGPPKALPEGLAFDPYLWSAAHYFRRSGAILANAPWMDLPILMMRPAHPSRWSYLDPDDAAQAMADAMAGGQALPDLDFVVREGPADFEMDAMLNRMGWSNSTGNSEFLRVFRRHW